MPMIFENSLSALVGEFNNSSNTDFLTDLWTKAIFLFLEDN